MKKQLIKIAALCAVLSLTAVSCQKEPLFDSTTQQTDVSSMYTIGYTIDGVSHVATFNSEEAYNQFLQYLFAMAREGYTVSFRNNAQQQAASSKERVVFTTDKESEAIAWGKKMSDDGYEVSIVYNPTTGIYTCTAIR